MKAIALSLSILTVACGPKLPSRLIEQHPRLAFEADRPSVVESSGPMPRWVRDAERGEDDTVVFVGQASASTKESAEVAAQDALSDSVARFIAVAVASESEATETHESENGRVKETQDVHQETRAHVEASVSKVSADANYWEKVAGRTGAPSWRFFVRARVKRSELERARLSIKCDRVRKAEKKVLAVLELAPELADLEARLAAMPGWFVITRADLAAASPHTDHRALAETAQSVAPDAVLRVTFESKSSAVALRFRLDREGGASASAGEELTGSNEKLFELEDALWSALERRLRSL